MFFKGRSIGLIGLKGPYSSTQFSHTLRPSQGRKYAQLFDDEDQSVSVNPTKTGLIPMMVFWCAVMGVLYFAMTHYLKPKHPVVLANGDLVIERSVDGHFYVMGTVNGHDAKFLIDTGASVVSVTDDFATKANIRGGVPATFSTANGERTGRIVQGIVVTVGPLSVTNVRVGVGLQWRGESDVLLGQSFLSKFDISLGKDQMVLRQR